jgi:hypothetical protein
MLAELQIRSRQLTDRRPTGEVRAGKPIHRERMLRIEGISP